MHTHLNWFAYLFFHWVLTFWRSIRPPLSFFFYQKLEDSHSVTTNLDKNYKLYLVIWSCPRFVLQFIPDWKQWIPNFIWSHAFSYQTKTSFSLVLEDSPTFSKASWQLLLISKLFSSSIQFCQTNWDEMETIGGWYGTWSTRRPLSTRIFYTKNVTHHHGLEPTTSCLPGRRTTNCVMVARITYTKWSNKVEIWQNLEKNATQIMIFLPHYMWAENNNGRSVDINWKSLLVLRFKSFMWQVLKFQKPEW